jgi:hypothetical protein
LSRGKPGYTLVFSRPGNTVLTNSERTCKQLRWALARERCKGLTHGLADCSAITVGFSRLLTPLIQPFSNQTASLSAAQLYSTFWDFEWLLWKFSNCNNLASDANANNPQHDQHELYRRQIKMHKKSVCPIRNRCGIYQPYRSCIGDQ